MESAAPGGSVHGKRRRHPIQINHLERPYFSVTCRGILADNLWKKCGMVRQAVRRRPAGLTLGCAPPGVWVLRGHPVAGNSAPGLPLFSVVFIGGCSGASIGKRDRKRPSQTRKSEHHGGCSASLNGGPCPFSLALFAAPARNRGAKKNPGPAPMPSSAGDCTPSRPRRRTGRAPGRPRPAAAAGRARRRAAPTASARQCRRLADLSGYMSHQFAPGNRPGTGEFH